MPTPSPGAISTTRRTTRRPCRVRPTACSRSSLTPLPGRIAARFKQIELPLGPRPGREALEKRSKLAGSEGMFARTLLEKLDRGETLSSTVPYPVQTWCFGDDLAMVFLGGEVVVDYALRLKWETDASRLWVTAYSNDVPCYIASKRVLDEGGYEADLSMVFYGRPARFAPEAEDLIVRTVHELLPRGLRRPEKAVKLWEGRWNEPARNRDRRGGRSRRRSRLPPVISATGAAVFTKESAPGKAASYNLVSEADLEAERAIVAVIRKAFPESRRAG